MSNPSTPQQIKSVVKAVDILYTFLEGNEYKSLAEISQKLGLGRSTAYRLLNTLKEKGLVRQNPETGQYRLGLNLMHLASRVLSGINVRSVARPHLGVLSKTVGESVHLACLSGREAIFIDKIQAEKSVGLIMTSYVGRVVPLYCTSVGKAILANQKSSFIENYLADVEFKAYTPNTLTDKEKLVQELKQTLSRGFAIDREELTEGLMCYGCPIDDGRGNVRLAVSFSGSISQMKDREEELVPNLIKAAHQISKDIAVSGLDLYSNFS